MKKIPPEGVSESREKHPLDATGRETMDLDWKQDLDELAAVRAETIRLFESLSQEELDFKPKPDSWSVNETVHHILLSEKLFRGEIQELVRLALAGCRPRLRRSFKDVDVSLFFIPKFMLPFLEVPFTIFNLFVPASLREVMTRIPIIRSTNPRVAEPEEGRPADELRAALESSLVNTQAVFESNPTLEYYRMVHQHPLMGVNNVLQLVRFIARHEQRHQEQIRRVVASRMAR